MAYELTATTDYIPEHEIFFVEVDLSQYLLEYYPHRVKYAPETSSEHDTMLKDLISCFAIHLALRTSFETHAWTFQMVSESPFSLFVTGNTGQVDTEGLSKGSLVGHVLTDSVRHADINGIHAQYSAEGKTSRSYVQSESSDVVAMVEAFYKRSEQRPIRIALSSDSDKAIGIMALPGCDLNWFETVELNSILSTVEHSVTRMRDCRFNFSCDCSPDKLLPFFKALTGDELDDIYGDDKNLEITCPRCGKVFLIDRAQIKNS